MTKVFLAVCAAFMMSGSQSGSAQAQAKPFRIAADFPTLTGTVVKVEAGNDSIGLWVQVKGKVHTFSLGPSTDGLPPQYQQNGPVGNPSVIDVGSQVVVMYSQGNYLEYRVLSRPAHLWITIAASEPLSAGLPSRQNQALKFSLYQQGCSTDVLNSNDYRALKPGYWVVAAGGFTSRAQAEVCRRKAASLGIKDAYVRQLW